MAQVILRQKAKSQLAKILEYAYQEYGQTTLNRFLEELEKIEHRLSIQPESYPLEYLSQSSCNSNGLGPAYES